jgi:hypothetical protein
MFTLPTTFEATAFVSLAAPEANSFRSDLKAAHMVLLSPRLWSLFDISSRFSAGAPV